MGRGVKLFDDPDIKLFILVGFGPELLVCCLAHRGSTDVFVCLFLLRGPGISIVGQHTESVSPRFFLFIIVVIMIYLFVLDDF